MGVLTESLEENGVLTLPSVEQIAQFSVLQLSGSDAADLLSVELVTVDERCLVAPCERVGSVRRLKLNLTGVVAVFHFSPVTEPS